MKKLLLVALVAMGATTFSAVQGTQGAVALPIVVTGEVVERTFND